MTESTHHAYAERLERHLFLEDTFIKFQAWTIKKKTKAFPLRKNQSYS